MRFNIQLQISNRSDGTGLSGHGIIGIVSRPAYVGFLGNLKFNFNPSTYQGGEFVGFASIQFYDSSNNLVATIPFDEIVNSGNSNIYTLSGTQGSFGSSSALIPYANFDFVNDTVGLSNSTVNAGNVFSPGFDSQTYNTGMGASSNPFKCAN